MLVDALATYTPSNGAMIVCGDGNGPYIKTAYHLDRVQELEREVERLKNQHIAFLITGGSVVMASEYDALRAERDSLKAQLAALDWRPITAENLPPGNGVKFLGWHPSWGRRVVLCHYDSDGELCGEWCEEQGETRLPPYNNPTQWQPINAPQGDGQ